ncbi:4Fe-4S double cluster binding domain-containing protein [Polycladidibacter hongkongensis]|uniref:4Fe-4S double cluster binding domain-containing protein n=1 Tax=Polycladidibacter hongkongensis TaxID=1647556 RepID=UPI00082BAC67|nr:reductive dehalogenase domain-containing protein [Pseudovibrio hongkongensis]
MRLFSYKNRPVHLGGYPMERLPRTSSAVALPPVPPPKALSYADAQNPLSLSNSIACVASLLDAIREGNVAPNLSEIPKDPQERADHLKAAGYFFDATLMGTCKITKDMYLQEPVHNPELAQLAFELQTFQPKTLASGIDMVLADLREAAKTAPQPIPHHTDALIVAVEHPRAPDPGEPGGEWIHGCNPARSAIRAAETAVVLASYLRLLGVEARAHTASSTDVNLAQLALASGLVERQEGGALANPFIGSEFSLAAITTTLELAPDAPLAPRNLADRWKAFGPSWQLGASTYKNAWNRKPYENRRFYQGAFPFEKIKRVVKPTTLIDAPRVPRVPKRADMFARALFGDMGKPLQDAAKGGAFISKNPMSFCARRALGALILRQDGDKAEAKHPSASDPLKNAQNVKAALYFLGCDAVGISDCPDYAYYSHDAGGREITPYHPNAISILVDQGHETMEGASGDDWISGAQSMRAYLRTSLIGDIVAAHIRSLGYAARVHSAVDGEVLQPPLLLLSGLGEVSRIGEVILNPYLGPRLKSGAITTDMPLAHDQPIDFGLQRFCESCNKCARECPSGAITAGPKRMFNGYEIWKSDSEKCARYRVSQPAGALCGRCMKTCPWNLEGIFAEKPFHWTAMQFPQSAPLLAKLDDTLGNGSINPVKKWWWDLEGSPAQGYRQAKQVNARELQTELDLRFEDQTLAVYPAHLAPHPYPYPFPMDREAGIRAYQQMLSPQEHKARLASGQTEGLVPQYKVDAKNAPVIMVEVSKVEFLSRDIARYEFTSAKGEQLPTFAAGAHIDVVIAPEYLRQYSLASDPAKPKSYVLGVQKEASGRGGSMLMHRIFTEGRKIFISKPHNHFPLHEDASHTIMFGGGIGITPFIAMAHRLHTLGRSFELHYSTRTREEAAFLEEMQAAPWAQNLFMHISEEGSRADLPSILQVPKQGAHIYTCGSDGYMQAVLEAATQQGWSEASLHKEYFSPPEQPEYENFNFAIHVSGRGDPIKVTAEVDAASALNSAGITVPTKCSDGICGVCAAHHDGSVPIEHRDFVLSAAERQSKIILCCSRPLHEGAVLNISRP